MIITELRTWILKQFKAMGATLFERIGEYFRMQDNAYLIGCLDVFYIPHLIKDMQD